MTDKYTPTVEEVRGSYGKWVGDPEWFDRMIAQVERAAAVKALREAADRLSHEFPQWASPSIGFEAAIVESLTSVRAFADRIESGENA